jgi:hypothetical protein
MATRRRAQGSAGESWAVAEGGQSTPEPGRTLASSMHVRARCLAGPRRDRLLRARAGLV